MRVLVIEDDVSIGEFIERTLREAGYTVDLARTAKRAESLIVEQEHAAVILDLGLPDRDGFDLIEAMRQQGISAPVLILSARRSVDDRVRGLEGGGDDYMTKPFAVAELLARLRNLLKRSSSSTPVATRLRASDLELDLVRREAVRGLRVLHLTAQEFRFLSISVVTLGELSLVR